MAHDPTATLVRLKDTDLMVEPKDDIRGMTVVDREDEQIGTVDTLVIDEQENRVRFLEVGSGGFLGIGEEKRLIPVDAVVHVDKDVVRVDTTRENVRGGPGYDPDLVELDPEYFGGIYGYYGYSPFWATGYVYPHPRPFTR